MQVCLIYEISLGSYRATNKEDSAYRFNMQVGLAMRIKQSFRCSHYHKLSALRVTDGANASGMSIDIQHAFSDVASLITFSSPFLRRGETAILVDHSLAGACYKGRT